ncbi:MAG TPA: hypothetical protein VF746_23605 [Longimicrobium sp.]|jgi:hypothetical protein
MYAATVKLRNVTFGALTIAALGFGATSALAGPAPAQCTDPSAQGTCQSQSDCRKICNRLSNGLIPFCDTQTQCCTCQKL